MGASRMRSDILQDFVDMSGKESRQEEWKVEIGKCWQRLLDIQRDQIGTGAGTEVRLER